MKYFLCNMTILFCAFLFSGCDQLQVRNQIADLKSENKKFEKRNLVLTAEVKDLTATIASLNTDTPGGADLQELRTALSRRESDVSHRAERVTVQEETLRVRERNVDVLEQEFYEKTGMKREEIGEARQALRERDRMMSQMDESSEKADSYLLYFAVMVVIFFVSVVVLIIMLMKYSATNKRVDSTMACMEAFVTDRDKQVLLASTLGRKMVYDVNECRKLKE